MKIIIELSKDDLVSQKIIELLSGVGHTVKDQKVKEAKKKIGKKKASTRKATWITSSHLKMMGKARDDMSRAKHNGFLAEEVLDKIFETNSAPTYADIRKELSKNLFSRYSEYQLTRNLVKAGKIKKILSPEGQTSFVKVA